MGTKVLLNTTCLAKLSVLAFCAQAICTGCNFTPPPPAKVIHHPEYGNTGKIQASEYILPAEELPALTWKNLDPWIQQFVGKQPPEAKKLLAERWSKIQHPALQGLRDRLLEFQPTSIVVHKDAGWLRLQIPATSPGIGDSFYLPAPHTADQWREALQPSGFAEHELLLEFVLHFGGMREDLPGMSGDFLDVDRVLTFPYPGYELSEIKNAAAWRGSLEIYHDRGGNGLLLHPQGKSGWWLFAEHEVVDEYDDFADFVRDFTQFNRDYSWPFDPYDPPSDARR